MAQHPRMASLYEQMNIDLVHRAAAEDVQKGRIYEI